MAQSGTSFPLGETSRDAQTLELCTLVHLLKKKTDFEKSRFGDVIKKHWDVTIVSEDAWTCYFVNNDTGRMYQHTEATDSEPDTLEERDDIHEIRAIIEVLEHKKQQQQQNQYSETHYSAIVPHAYDKAITKLKERIGLTGGHTHHGESNKILKNTE